MISEVSDTNRAGQGSLTIAQIAIGRSSPDVQFNGSILSQIVINQIPGMNPAPTIWSAPVLTQATSQAPLQSLINSLGQETAYGSGPGVTTCLKIGNDNSADACSAALTVRGF